MNGKRCLHKFRRLPDGSLECKLCGERVEITPISTEEIPIKRDKYSHEGLDRKILRLFGSMRWW